MKCVVVWVSLIALGCVSANSQIQSDALGYVPSLGDTAPGSVWPQPQSLTSTSQTYQVAVEKFTFSYASSSHSCSLLAEAFKRYEIIMMDMRAHLKLHFQPRAPATVTTLQINLMSECESYPSLDMNEAYTLDVGDNSQLTSESVWGILRGLETFSQLLWENEGQIVVNKTSIVDHPRYAHRGILLDTARHYLPLDVILRNLDGMAYNKFNVFHWHIVDDQSFPYVSQVYPDLSMKGAYTSTHIYTPDDVAAVIEYARLRGIRVVPEFDTPGHSQSWGKGQPDLLTPCYKDNAPDGTFGPINPIMNSSYTFIDNLFTELRSVFHDKYIHLGGDEVSFACWQSNPDIIAYVKEHNITSYSQLEAVYIQQVLEISEKVGFSYIVWQEVIDNGVPAKNDTVVEVWIDNKPDEELAKVTGLGYRALISAPWYLDYISYGEDWKRYYTYEPSNFNGTDAQKALLVGGEACLWAEYVDATNVTPRLWPRASAIAERLWSDKSVNDVNTATPRLHQHRCRMMQRGISAEPLHPGYCVHEWRNY